MKLYNLNLKTCKQPCKTIAILVRAFEVNCNLITSVISEVGLSRTREVASNVNASVAQTAYKTDSK